MEKRDDPADADGVVRIRGRVTYVLVEARSGRDTHATWDVSDEANRSDPRPRIVRRARDLAGEEVGHPLVEVPLGQAKVPRSLPHDRENEPADRIVRGSNLVVVQERAE